MTTIISSDTREANVGTFGLIAEFDTSEATVEAAKRAYSEGYRYMEAYSPMPIDGLSEAMGFTRNRVSMLVLIGGVTGGFLGFFMQWYTAVIDYPLNIGGRPFNSWPSFMPITFELTVLLAAFAAVFGMLALNGLPRLHHPVFNVPRFERASRDGFFFMIMSQDPKFDMQGTRQFLEALSPKAVSEVES